MSILEDFESRAVLLTHIVNEPHNPLPVRIVGSEITERKTPQKSATNTYQVPTWGVQANSTFIFRPIQILNPAPGRNKARVNVNSAGGTLTNPPAGTTPAVPATGVAAQNLNPYGVQVVINANGATITNVSVNGVTVGTGAGTYFVPQGGSISIAYSVATPTWTWTEFPAVLTGGATSVLLARAEEPLAKPTPELNSNVFQILASQMPYTLTWESDDPCYAVAVGGGPVTISVLDERYRK